MPPKIGHDALAVVARGDRPGRRAPGWPARGSARGRAPSGDAGATARCWRREGCPKASVLPEPVGALPQMSRPASAGGMVAVWMVRGSVMPGRARRSLNGAGTPRSEKVVMTRLQSRKERPTRLDCSNGPHPAIAGGTTMIAGVAISLPSWPGGADARPQGALGHRRVVRRARRDPRRRARRRAGGRAPPLPHSGRDGAEQRARRRQVAHLGRGLARVPVPQLAAQRAGPARQRRRAGRGAARHDRPRALHGDRHRQVRPPGVGLQPVAPRRLPQPHAGGAASRARLPAGGVLRLPDRRHQRGRCHPVRLVAEDQGHPGRAAHA